MIKCQQLSFEPSALTSLVCVQQLIHAARGRTRNTSAMDNNADSLQQIRAWCERHGLTDETQRVLRQEGFTSVQFLRLLTPEEVDKSFKQTHSLPLAQCLALQQALTELGHPHSCAGAVGGIGIAGQTYRFLLVGKTGSGKSSTGNSILGADLFDDDVGFDSKTFRCQLKRAQVHGKTIEIMDSPGLFDTHRTHEEISTDIVKAVTCMHPGPHAILYVIKLGRFTDEEYEVYARLKALFDEDVAKHVIVIFTGGDVLEKEGRGIEEVMRKVPGNLRKVLGDCQYRVVVFNNIAQDKRPYVTKLLQLVNSMLAENGGGYYTCPRYADVGEGMEEEVARRLTEMEKELLAEKPFIKELTEKAHGAEEELQGARQLFKTREQQRQLELQASEERAEAEMEALLAELKKKDCNMGQERLERQNLLERQEKERQDLQREIERQREQDRKDMEQRERDLKTVIEKAEKEQQKFLETKRQVYQRKIDQLKDRIVKDEETGFLDKIVKGVHRVVGAVVAHLPDPLMTVAAKFLAK